MDIPPLKVKYYQPKGTDASVPFQ